MRGFFGIGAYGPRNTTNLGTLWRSCLEYDAAFMFVVASRCGLYGFEDQPSNTTRSERHIPLYVYPSFEEFANVLPTGAMLVGIEQTDRSTPLESFEHPERAIYLLGAEDTGLPERIFEYCRGGIVSISTKRCLNVAVAGSIVMYDRKLKGLEK